MGVCRSTGTDLAEEGSRRDAGPVRATVFCRMFAHPETGKFHLEVLIKWELNSNVRQPKKGRGQARIERLNSFGVVHFPRRVQCRCVVPRSTHPITGGSAALRHQAGFDNPNRVGQNGRARAGGQG